jgi:hypothetical protein
LTYVGVFYLKLGCIQVFFPLEGATSERNLPLWFANIRRAPMAA